jgi:hypothetical protein
VNDQLDKRARQLVLFPWLGLIASFQANNRVSDMDRFARSHFQVARQAVALVQYTDRRHTFRHRRRRDGLGATCGTSGAGSFKLSATIGGPLDGPSTTF